MGLRDRGARPLGACVCGKPHAVRVHLSVREKAPSGSGAAITSFSRTLCEACADALLEDLEQRFPRVRR